MIRNVDFPEIKDVAVAIVPETNEAGVEEWFVYVINYGKKAIKNLMVTSNGYGKKDGKDVKTSTLRRFLDNVEAMNSIKVEPIHEEVFGLNNEYWVSFYRGNKIYDKKYLFIAGSISNKFLVEIPVLNCKGIWHP
ncbi:MAG: hypothetical protein CL840_07990 [Crocinitomicaceae bacterium]|nr:hypothetical protein [Crocinitomicaceae bacterium]|tara:strand:+ start:16360 stop:16764 length:405 start_codon:yes stop_codon:yes gene_type:complete